MVTSVKNMKTTKGSIQFLVIGAVVSPEMVRQLDRVKKFRGTIDASPKIHNVLSNSGVKSLDFTKNEGGVVMHHGYPKTGLPSSVMTRIIGYDMPKDQKMIPYSIVVAEIDQTTGVVKEGEPFNKVQETFHYNTANVIFAAANAGKIVCTTPKQLEQVLNRLEAAGEITEGEYDTIATVYLSKVTRAITSWMERIYTSTSNAYVVAKAELEKISFFAKVTA